jgi:hypothetical protein
MAIDLLAGWENCFFPVIYLECNSDISHLLPYRILPKCVAVIFVQSDAFIVGLLVISFGDDCDDAAALLDDIWDPPNKGRDIM